MEPSLKNLHKPQVKICGLTSAEEAAACAESGADAIGCIFYPRSPRNLTESQASEICAALPPQIGKVGVFVDETLSAIRRKVERCGLTAVQLHGRESPALVESLLDSDITVIKALFIAGAPTLADASDYAASAFLVECGIGALPGGNARSWDWQQADAFARKYPLILAGGLSPDNISEALRMCRPAAVDVSSGVEKSPGKKDLQKVKRFLDAVSHCRLDARLPGIF